MKETIEELLGRDPGSLDDTLRTVETLLENLKTNPGAWENPTLDRFLEAMHAWLSSVRTRIPDPSSWKVFQAMLEAAKVYE